MRTYLKTLPIFLMGIIIFTGNGVAYGAESTISGMLTAPDGTPVTGVSARIFAYDDGDVREGILNTEEGTYTIVVSDGEWIMAVDIDPSSGFSSRIDNHRVAVTSQPVVYNIVLEQFGAIIFGKLVAPDGGTLKNALINVINLFSKKGDYASSAKADANGLYSFFVPAGNYSVSAFSSSNNEILNPETQKLSIQNGQFANLSFLFGKANRTITGFVYPFGSGTLVSARSDKGYYTEGYTDSFGAYKLRVRENDIWHLQAIRSNGTVSYRSKEVSIQVASDVGQNLPLVEVVLSPQSVTKIVPAGVNGFVSLSNGMRISVLKNSITTSDYQVQVVPSVKASPPSVRVIGPVYDISFSTLQGASLLSTHGVAVVEIPYDENLVENEAGLKLSFWDDVSGAWQFSKSSFVDTERNVVVGFSNYLARVGVTDPEPDPDTTAPVITLLGSSNVQLTVGDTYNDAGATATDDTDGNLTSSIVTVNPVNTAVAGTYTVTYNVTDSAGNTASQVSRTVVVSSPVSPPPPPPSGGGGSSAPASTDTTGPVITLNGASSVSVIQGSVYVEQGATAVDVVSGSASVFISGLVNTNVVGTYTVSYSASDISGNTSTVTRTVNVIASTPTLGTVTGTVSSDTTAPLISNISTFVAGSGVNITATTNEPASSSIAINGTTIQQNNKIIVHSFFFPNVQSNLNYTGTITVTDSAGNSSSETFTFSGQSPATSLSTDASTNVAVSTQTSTGSATISQNLTLGATGADVINLQNILIEQGFLIVPPGVSLGYFGQLTKDAVVAYQSANGLPATGFVGPLTIASLTAGNTGTQTSISAPITTPPTTPVATPPTSVASATCPTSFTLPSDFPVGFRFAFSLNVGSSGQSVLRLQQFLNSVLSKPIATAGAGSPGFETTYYGPITTGAVHDFQKACLQATLDAQGISQGTDNVGPGTRAELNRLLEEAGY